MKQDIAIKWAEALESGEYEQGQGALCYAGKHCCLGVLCEILGVPRFASKLDRGKFYYGEGSYDGQHGFLPADVMALAGVATEDGRFGEMSPDAWVCRDSLTALNDRGTPFASIAQRIRSEWATL